MAIGRRWRRRSLHRNQAVPTGFRFSVDSSSKVRLCSGCCTKRLGGTVAKIKHQATRERHVMRILAVRLKQTIHIWLMCLVWLVWLDICISAMEAKLQLQNWKETWKETCKSCHVLFIFSLARIGYMSNHVEAAQVNDALGHAVILRRLIKVCAFWETRWPGDLNQRLRRKPADLGKVWWFWCCFTSHLRHSALSWSNRSRSHPNFTGYFTHFLSLSLSISVYLTLSRFSKKSEQIWTAKKIEQRITAPWRRQPRSCKFSEVPMRFDLRQPSENHKKSISKSI